jgi:predicted transcriptional regulator
VSKELPAVTKLLDHALTASRRLSPTLQDEIARVVLRLAGADDEPAVPLTREQEAVIAASKAAADRGEFASDEEVRAVCAEHGL